MLRINLPTDRDLNDEPLLTEKETRPDPRKREDTMAHEIDLLSKRGVVVEILGSMRLVGRAPRNDFMVLARPSYVRWKRYHGTVDKFFGGLPTELSLLFKHMTI